ncbi:hypothetical protein Slala03_15690 [Streptomyces lavendulae subsp. lavendulae]|nr:hypothetical protein Slala03_15690 [Streptomyces lavendulae subsp. lavendulae]GLW01794.1 hypothetical protein Slala05_54250 [Streptomyces lavendulae subsp. lavendulae]GLX39942.1 hypothetical protein Sros01_60150 [Streptomyces roseochromogenus]
MAPSLAGDLAACVSKTHRENRLEGCRGFNGPCPSAPLDERYGTGTRALWRAGAFVRGDPGMPWSFALFKTVTEGQGG